MLHSYLLLTLVTLVSSAFIYSITLRCNLALLLDCANLKNLPSIVERSDKTGPQASLSRSSSNHLLREQDVLMIDCLSSVSFSISLVVSTVCSSDELFYCFMCIVWCRWICQAVNDSSKGCILTIGRIIHLEVAFKGQLKGVSESPMYHSN
ncbi:hypothetical protein EDC96DRAFT_550189 [Choanephora cucurbitarum]|nr:hypothetical protein EDC96DRAFT_550189 [Choanephora cucurbitarum]